MGARVALIGASGIGKHHARWWTLEGAEVCAFAGSTERSVAATREMLATHIAFSGRGYTDVQQMLEEEQPDYVDVCSPTPCHALHVRTALTAGCHVFCEKPFVYSPSLPKDELLAEAKALLALAQSQGCRLNVCTQYTLAAQHFSQWWRTRYGDMPIRFCRGHLEAPARGRGPDALRIWIDLSPHLLSVIQQLYPHGTPLWDTLAVNFAGYEASASFDLRTNEGEVVRCECLTKNRTTPPGNIRQFQWNDTLFDVEGFQDTAGVFALRIKAEEETMETEDMMRQLIRQVLAGAKTDEKIILDNLAWMLEIATRANICQSRKG